MAVLGPIRSSLDIQIYDLYGLYDGQDYPCVVMSLIFCACKFIEISVFTSLN